MDKMTWRVLKEPEYRAKVVGVGKDFLGEGEKYPLTSVTTHGRK